MILVCDIGNTRIKSCLYDGKNISGAGSFDSFDDFEKFVSGENFNECVFSSVVPGKTNLLKKLLKNITPYQVTHSSSFNLKIEYRTPETLGIDRICSAEGAYYLFNESGKNYSGSDFIISIDFGTATTLNFIKYPGVFPGGMILPGLQLMFDSLSKNTAQLPAVSVQDYKGLTGTDTKSSIASGVINSQAGLIEKTINDIKSEYRAHDVHVYITGGNAEKIMPYLKFNFEFIGELVLTGIIAVYKKNN